MDGHESNDCRKRLVSNYTNSIEEYPNFSKILSPPPVEVTSIYFELEF